MTNKIVSILKQINVPLGLAAKAVGNVTAMSPFFDPYLLASVALHMATPTIISRPEQYLVPLREILAIMNDRRAPRVLLAAFVCGFLAADARSAVNYSDMLTMAQTTPDDRPSSPADLLSALFGGGVS